MPREFSAGQKRIVDRYYDNRDTIALTKLMEIVSDLALAETPAKQGRLWTRAEAHLKALKANPARVEKLLAERDPAQLAAFAAELSRR
ncbi:MAG: hypothetical protein AAGB51_08945 [Planctomycetota bacterium]